MSQQSSGIIQKRKKSAVFWEPLGAPVPLKTLVRNFIHPLQFGILPKRLSLPYGFSAWVKSDPETILHRHIVVATGANPAFREAPLMEHSSKEEYRFDADVPNRLTERKRLSIKNWYPGPRRGKKTHRKTYGGEVAYHHLQEAIEYLDREYFTNRFYVTHHGGCAILFNKDTFHQDIKVTSVYLHDTWDPQQQDVKEGELGWVLQCVIPRASFPRLPRNSKSFFTADPKRGGHCIITATQAKDLKGDRKSVPHARDADGQVSMRSGETLS